MERRRKCTLEDDLDDIRNRLDTLPASIPAAPFQQVTISIEPVDGRKQLGAGNKMMNLEVPGQAMYIAQTDVTTLRTAHNI